MESPYIKELEDLAALLKKEGWGRRALIIRTAARRMELMEELITDITDSVNEM